MKVYGLTGKTGAGKSTVAKLFEQKGFFIIDGDAIARELTAEGSPVLDELAGAFGEDIIRPDGKLDRRLLASRAFACEENRLILNLIMHGKIDSEIRKQLADAEKAGFEFALIDAAALLESPSRELCEEIIVVSAKKETRLKRILARDGITDEEALRRINAQKPDEYYLSNADYVIYNYGDDTAEQVDQTVRSIKEGDIPF